MPLDYADIITLRCRFRLRVIRRCWLLILLRRYWLLTEMPLKRFTPLDTRFRYYVTLRRYVSPPAAIRY